MDVQLSLFDVPKERVSRVYFRDRYGRFATKEQAERERLKREVEYYKYKYEAEKRKNNPLVKVLIDTQRENLILKNRQNG